MVQKASGDKAAAPVDPAVREALQKDLEPLEAVSSGLALRVAEFVLTGKDEAALAEVAQAQQQTRGYGTQQGLLQGAGFAHEQKLFLKDHGPHPLPMLLRFGKVLAAAQPGWRLGYGSTLAQRDDIRWLAHLLLEHHESLRYNAAAEATNKNPHLRNAETLVSLAAEAGVGLDVPIEVLFSQSGRWGSYGSMVGIRRELEGLDAVMQKHAEAALMGFAKLVPQGKVAFVEDLSRLNIALHAPFTAFVWEQACSSSKTMAGAARSVLARLPPDDAIALARTTFESGDAAARRGAAEALAQIAGATARDVLLAQARSEKSKGASEAIEALVSQLDSLGRAKAGIASNVATGGTASAPAGATVLSAIDGSEIVIPPTPSLPADTPLPAEALDPLRAAIPAYNDAVRDLNAKSAAHHQARGWTGKPCEVPEIDADRAIPELLSLLNGAGATSHAFNDSRALHWIPKEMMAAFEQVLAHPGITLWHLARLVKPRTAGWRSLMGVALNPSDAVFEWSFSARCKDGVDFRVIAGIGAAIGLPPDQHVRLMLQAFNFARTSVAELPSLRFHILEQIDVVEEALGMRPKLGTQELDTERALELLEELGVVPEQFLKPLLDLAIGSRKTLHKPARALLKSAAGVETAIVVRLADPKKEVRTAAATWLGERRQVSAAPALETALKKEKSEEGRAAILTALSRLGADISEHLSERTLKAEAIKGLEKTPAKTLDWFPLDSLPALKWSNGKKVDPLILKWWVILADKLKSPGGNALFDFYLDRLRPEDASALGQFMLSTFIARDTVSPSEVEAQAAAKAFADQQQQSWQRRAAGNPQAAQYSFDYAQVFEFGRLSKLGQHLHSAAEHRGILALASRASGPDAAALVRRYLKENGAKTSQSRSLLAALSANPAPAAIQVVLAAANRLKQKSTQAFAVELVQAIAERRGWTRDELADRTIPTGGFDEAGELELPCGVGRLFKAIYHGGGRIELTNPAGKPAKALPQPRGEDSAEKEQIAASKKALSSARKEVKQVEKLQAERLYEAMCVERTWPVQVWRDNLNDHPIVGRLCRRLVWLGLDGEGKVVASFRPLDDGTLTGNDDASVSFDSLLSVKLAHQALLLEKDTEAWSIHLRDYEVPPLFQQLGRPLLRPGSEMAKATELDDRKGWMIDSFKIASIAGKLGYERGPAEDGGHFSTYVKRFLGANLSAVVHFTGHYIAENKQVPCALIGLSFVPITQGHGFGRTVALGRVAPVLLSEVWGDLHAIAAAGSGYDKDWEKVGY